jgi:hypothetical protein
MRENLSGILHSSLPTPKFVPEDVGGWQRLRHTLATRRQHRTLRLRFRRDPAAYLAKLEADFLQLILLP